MRLKVLASPGGGEVFGRRRHLVLGSGNEADSEDKERYIYIYIYIYIYTNRLCGLVVRVLGYRSGGPGSIPGTTRKKMWVWNGVHVSTTEELLDRKVAAPV
jgi:hypothetical protein